MAQIVFTAAGGITATGQIQGSTVVNAVWNDLADCLEVPEDTKLEYGRCYCFDGTNYHKSTKYLDDGIIGIHSDTYGFKMGIKETKTLDVAIAGFVLAYVDKEYPPGTPLTCAENGTLTEISKQDKIEYPEKIVGTYWKPEPMTDWRTDGRLIVVKGRHWIKVN